MRRLTARNRRHLLAAAAVVFLLATVVSSGKRGDGACVRQQLMEDDVISNKFMEDHICLIGTSAPTDLRAFCRDFRHGQPVYQVMLLEKEDIKRLRKDLKGHQEDFYNDRTKFRPLLKKESLVHYTTDGTYTFIYCDLNYKNWKAKRKSNEYLRYIPYGTPKGIYKIYHGCHPVQKYSGFRQLGSC